jgi:hypothetical protein
MNGLILNLLLLNYNKTQYIQFRTTNSQTIQLDISYNKISTPEVKIIFTFNNQGCPSIKIVFIIKV